ncbi:hypothetical protein BJ508DRAFT_330837, partial [Ascobolus immersus RN42]
MSVMSTPIPTGVPHPYPTLQDYMEMTPKELHDLCEELRVEVGEPAKGKYFEPSVYINNLRSADQEDLSKLNCGELFDRCTIFQCRPPKRVKRDMVEALDRRMRRIRHDFVTMSKKRRSDEEQKKREAAAARTLDVIVNQTNTNTNTNTNINTGLAPLDTSVGGTGYANRRTRARLSDAPPATPSAKRARGLLAATGV